MPELTAATIPQERLRAYASTAATAGDLQALLTAIHQICTDRAILQSEGRSAAVRGADRLLAGVVRRLCATAAWSEQTAKTKVAVLNATKRSYGGGRHGILMAAMIDAAIGIETESWLASPTVH